MKAFFFAAIFVAQFLGSVAPTAAADLVEANTNGGGGHGGYPPAPPYSCPKYCSFPPHSVSKCSPLEPCGFTCKDGYAPFPLLKPVKCVCVWPFTECNGQCGIFKACPSHGHHKRDLTAEMAKCPAGYSACGILGRHTGSWECVDTQRDLESCGGCFVSALNDANAPQGQDCTAISGVSDVSCVKGRCEVRKCVNGYEVGEDGTSCELVDRKKQKSVLTVAGEVFAAEFGFDAAL